MINYFKIYNILRNTFKKFFRFVNNTIRLIKDCSSSIILVFCVFAILKIVLEGGFL